MRSTGLFLCVVFTISFSNHLSALECGNSGQAPTTLPDDTGDGNATACGSAAQAGGTSATALGHLAVSGGDFATALGYDADGVGGASIALGYAANSGGSASVALGAIANSPGADSIALGSTATSGGSNSIAIGTSTSAPSFSSTAVGHFATAVGEYSATFGYGASSAGSVGTAVGYAASSGGSGGAALGFIAAAGGDFSSALGYGSVANGESSTALGNNASAPALRATAVGFAARANTQDTVVLGAIAGDNGASVSAKVGIGTNNPTAPLQVQRTDGTAQIYVREVNSTSAARTLFKLSNKGNTKFEIAETGTGSTWAFTNSGSDFRVSLQGSGVVEFLVANNGNATLAGALTQNSDRNAKQAIVPVDPDEVLSQVVELPISRWEYKDASGVTHLGPMAQDFHAAFGLGESETGISTLDTGGVALAAIQALERRNRELEARNADLEERLALLETAMAGLLPRAAQR